jgi:hypothetical protein
VTAAVLERQQVAIAATQRLGRFQRALAALDAGDGPIRPARGGGLARATGGRPRARWPGRRAARAAGAGAPGEGVMSAAELQRSDRLMLLQLVVDQAGIIADSDQAAEHGRTDPHFATRDAYDRALRRLEALVTALDLADHEPGPDRDQLARQRREYFVGYVNGRRDQQHEHEEQLRAAIVQTRATEVQQPAIAGGGTT